MGANQINSGVENTKEILKLSYIDNKDNLDEYLDKVMDYFELSSRLRGPSYLVAKFGQLYIETLEIKKFYDSIGHKDDKIDIDQGKILDKIKSIEGYENLTKEEFETFKRFRNIGNLSANQKLLLTMNMKK